MGEIADALRRAESLSHSSRRPHPVAPPQAPRSTPSAHAPASAPSAEQPLRVGARAGRVVELGRIVLEGEESRWAAARRAVTEPRGVASQQFGRIALRLRDMADSRGARSIVVTSAQPGDGKTTIACNLAVQIARLDQSFRTVLIDLDLRRACLVPALGVEVVQGVDAVLRGELEAAEAAVETDLPGLFFLGLGRPVDDPEWLLSTPNLEAMIRELENEFDRIIIDTPPILAVPDAQIILRLSDAGIFVVRAGITPVRSVKAALEHIAPDRFLGTLLNSSPADTGLSSYYEDYPSSDANDRAGRRVPARAGGKASSTDDASTEASRGTEQEEEHADRF